MNFKHGLLLVNTKTLMCVPTQSSAVGISLHLIALYRWHLKYAVGGGRLATQIVLPVRYNEAKFNYVPVNRLT
jgi:hypothetical protein